MLRLAVAIVLATAGVAIAGPPDPEATEAARAFEEGRELARQNRFTEACERFAKSYELDPGLGTAVNLADCLERQGHLRRAWELFDVVARNSPDRPSRARLARGRADALVAKLARVVITLRDPGVAGLAVRIGDREVAPAAEIRELIEPRDVELVATAPGRPAFRLTLHAVAGGTVSADIPAFAALDDEPGRSTRRRRSRVYLAGGLGAAALVGLGVSLERALAAKRTYDSAFDNGCMRMGGDVLCAPGGTGVAIIDRAGGQADLATGFAVAGAVLAGAAAAVFFTAPRETIQVAPIATRHELGVGIAGRF
jgi:tetratricopeptide (TPR) repeat protein